ncbi:MAG: minor capsid protein [Corynebacterium sp.]|nr:minor capsid protein [Corynebacterium sp.]
MDENFEESLFYGFRDAIDDLDVDPILGLYAAEGDTIGVAFYGVDDHGTMTDSIQGMQLDIRSGSRDSRGTPRLSAAIFDRLQGLTRAEWYGVPIVHVYRNSSAYLGTDEGGRHRKTDNYYIQLSRAGRHRTDT